MSNNIRNDREVHGLTIGNTQIKLSQLADDTTIFLNDYNSIKRVLDILQHFEKCAGLKLNKDKTEAIKLGISSNTDKKTYGLKWVPGPVKVLGIWVGKDQQQIRSKNFDIKLDKLKRKINMWKPRNLSIKGKITVLRSQILPLVLYPGSVLFAHEDFTKEVDSAFYDFIWPKKNIM